MIMCDQSIIKRTAFHIVKTIQKRQLYTLLFIIVL